MPKKTMQEAIFADIINYRRNHTPVQKRLHLVLVLLIVLCGCFYHTYQGQEDTISKLKQTVSQQALEVIGANQLADSYKLELDKATKEVVEVRKTNTKVRLAMATLEKDYKKLDAAHRNRYNILEGKMRTQLTNLSNQYTQFVESSEKIKVSLDRKVRELLNQLSDANERSRKAEQRFQQIKLLLK